ncbi:MAG: 2-phosphosulfolactate phosphatase [Thermoplasmataceae archaeon]
MKVDIIEGRKTEKFPESTKVLVDIFRSTSTMPIMIRNGAKYIIPTKTVKEARSIRREHPEYILAGERLGKRVPRFDYGNSPYEVWSKDFTDKIIIFTSTNGTKVLEKIKGRGEIYVGSFINISAIVSALSNEQYVSIVVSGRPDGIADEDLFFAEHLRERLLGKESSVEDYISKVKASKGARRLRLLGAKEDIGYSLKADSVDFPLIYRDGRIFRPE